MTLLILMMDLVREREAEVERKRKAARKKKDEAKRKEKERERRERERREREEEERMINKRKKLEESRKREKAKREREEEEEYERHVRLEKKRQEEIRRNKEKEAAKKKKGGFGLGDFESLDEEMDSFDKVQYSEEEGFGVVSEDLSPRFRPTGTRGGPMEYPSESEEEKREVTKGRLRDVAAHIDHRSDRAKEREIERERELKRQKDRLRRKLTPDKSRERRSTPNELREKGRDISAIKFKDQALSDQDSILDIYALEEKEEVEFKNRMKLGAHTEKELRIRKKVMELREDLKKEIILKSEIDELKNEITQIDQKISTMKKKQVRKAVKGGVNDILKKQTKEVLKKQDMEIERYKQAYHSLLESWKNGMATGDEKFKPTFKKNTKALKIKSIPGLIGSSTMSHHLVQSQKQNLNAQAQAEFNDSYVGKYLSRLGEDSSSYIPLRNRQKKQQITSNLAGKPITFGRQKQNLTSGHSRAYSSSAYKTKDPLSKKYLSRISNFDSNFGRREKPVQASSIRSQSYHQRPSAQKSGYKQPNFMVNSSLYSNSQFLASNGFGAGKSNFGGSLIPRAKVVVQGGSMRNSTMSRQSRASRQSRDSYKAIDDTMKKYQGGGSEIQQKLNELRLSAFHKR